MIIKRWSELLSFFGKPSEIKSFLGRFFGSFFALLFMISVAVFSVVFAIYPIVYLCRIEGTRISGWTCAFGIIVWLIVDLSLCFAIFPGGKESKD